MRNKITASVILLLAITLGTTWAYGSEDSGVIESKKADTEIEIVRVKEAVQITESEKISGETSGIIAYDSEELKSEVEKVYTTIANSSGLSYEKVRLVHIMAGGSVAFFNRRPDVEVDTTVVETFNIPGSKNTQYKDFNYRGNKVKADKYNMLSSGYNVCKDIKTLMEKRKTIQRGTMQSYFDNLLPEIRENIVFYEALMEHMRFEKENIDNFYIGYEKTVHFKVKDENIVYIDDLGNYLLKEEYRNIFEASNVYEIDKLALVLSSDERLASNINSNELREFTTLPYIVGYTSRAELLKASTSLIGRVRYVWGGGHGLESKYRGISPIWQKFDKIYEDKGEEVNGYCIQPSSSWCPVHGFVGRSNNGCLFRSNEVSDINTLEGLRENIYSLSNIERVLLERQLGSEFRAINLHRLEGLDCSGYVSWVFNQIDGNKVYNSTAARFNYHERMIDVKFGGDLLLGDTIAWDKHIALVVAKVAEKSKAYVIIEMRPDTVMFGVAHFPGASKEDIEYGKELARQANLIIGNVKDHVSNYDLQKLQYRNSTQVIEVENPDGTKGQEIITNSQKVLTFGRLNKAYIDEDSTIEVYEKSIEDMNAKEVLQYIIDELPHNYKDGVMEYENGEKQKLYNIK